MKTIFKTIFVLLSIVLFSSFVTKEVFTGTKSQPLDGTKQIFVNSTKQIDYTDFPMSVGSFKNKISDSITEGFQIYTFDFDKNVLSHHFYDYDQNDSIVDKTYTLDIKMIKSNADFAFFSVTDKTGYYNDITEKLMIINLKDNPNYPKLQIIWKDGDDYKGVYSVDTRDFNEMFTDSDTNVFDK